MILVISITLAYIQYGIKTAVDDLNEPLSNRPSWAYRPTIFSFTIMALLWIMRPFADARAVPPGRDRVWFVISGLIGCLIKLLICTSVNYGCIWLANYIADYWAVRLILSVVFILMSSFALAVLLPLALVAVYALGFLTPLILLGVCLWAWWKYPDTVELVFKWIVGLVVGIIIFIKLKGPKKTQPNISKEGNKTNDSVSAQKLLEDRETYLKNEKPFMIIDLGTRKAQIKASDIQSVANVMLFAWKYAKMEKAKALKYSITTFVLTVDGTTQEKIDAETTMDEALKWSIFNRDLDMTEKHTLSFECAYLIKKYLGVA